MGKKFLHGFCGMIIGAGAGFFMVHNHHVYGMIGGAILGAIAAFFLTDTFWEHLKDIIE